MYLPTVRIDCTKGIFFIQFSKTAINYLQQNDSFYIDCYEDKRNRVIAFKPSEISTPNGFKIKRISVTVKKTNRERIFFTGLCIHFVKKMFEYYGNYSTIFIIKKIKDYFVFIPKICESSYYEEIILKFIPLDLNEIKNEIPPTLMINTGKQKYENKCFHFNIGVYRCLCSTAYKYFEFKEETDKYLFIFKMKKTKDNDRSVSFYGTSDTNINKVRVCDIKTIRYLEKEFGTLSKPHLIKYHNNGIFSIKKIQTKEQ